MSKLRKLDNNVDVLNAMRNEAGLLYMSRLPKVTRANVRETMQKISQERILMNEFVGSLINRIGANVYRRMSWNNPLAQFKGQKIVDGSMIQEIKVGLIQARVYSADRDYLEQDLFGKHDIDVATAYHEINRQNYYPVTINEYLLRRALADGERLSDFVTQLMEAPATSDNVDEFTAMVSLIPEYESMDGFFKMPIGDLTGTLSDTDKARTALRQIRAVSGEMEFPSTVYNPAHMPTYADKSDQILITTPEVQASLDVDGLAMLFNMSKGDIAQRIITVPKRLFGDGEIQAILTTSDFFVVHDTLIETTSQSNALGLSANYFLHHHQILSVSKFVPAVALTKTASSEVVKIQKPANVKISAVKATEVDGSALPSSGALPGQNVLVTATLSGTNTDNVAVDYDVEDNTSTRTHMTNEGVLTVGTNETATNLKVRATVSYAGNEGDSHTKTANVKVDASKAYFDFPKPEETTTE